MSPRPARYDLEEGARTAVVSPHDYEEVHRARFGDFVAEQPEALVVAELRGVHLGLECRRVVQRELVAACSAGPCADVLLHGEQGDRARSSAEEGPCWAADDVKERMVRRRDAKRCVDESLG